MSNSTMPARSRHLVSEKNFKLLLRSGNNRLTHISAIAKPLAKKLIIRAYCQGWLSKQRTQELFRKLDLGDC